MDTNKILAHCDHTLLSPTATWEDIKKICDEGMKYQTASVCIPPCFVGKAKDYVGNNLKICTVIGFPNGNVPTDVKVFEAIFYIESGADEVDMVINLGELKAGNYDYVKDEIRKIKKVSGDHVVKVIIETCLLTEEEKKKMCEIVSEAGADYIKTSTGFSTAGATFEDIELFRENVGPSVKIKAAGGISSLEDAERFLSLGADRLGTSKVVKIVKEMEKKTEDIER